MTIEIIEQTAADISMENEVIYLKEMASRKNCRISAKSWLTTGDAFDSSLYVLKNLHAQIKRKLSTYEVWLFIGSSSWQPNTRIVRHQQLWGALKLRGVSMPCGRDCQEVAIESAKGIKFFGAARLSAMSTESAVAALLSERCSFICCLPKDAEIKKFLNIGWTGHIPNDLDFICHVAQSDGCVLKNVGEFDDLEWGFVYLGPLKLAQKLEV